MNISRTENRVLHILAQGGCIRHERGPSGRIDSILCFTRDGYVYGACTIDVFRRLKTKGLIHSRNSGPYHISRKGRESVAARPDNR